MITSARLGDVGVLLVEHRVDVDVTDLGDDQFEQQFAAEVAEVDDRRGKPLAKLGTSGSGGGEDRAIPTGDSWFLADRSDVVALIASWSSER